MLEIAVCVYFFPQDLLETTSSSFEENWCGRQDNRECLGILWLMKWSQLR